MPWDSQRDVSTTLDLKVGPPKGLISLLWHSVRKNNIFTDDALHFEPSIRNIGCFTDGVLDLRIDSARVEESLPGSLHRNALTALDMMFLDWDLHTTTPQGTAAGKYASQLLKAGAAEGIFATFGVNLNQEITWVSGYEPKWLKEMNLNEMRGEQMVRDWAIFFMLFSLFFIDYWTILL